MNIPTPVVEEVKAAHEGKGATARKTHHWKAIAKEFSDRCAALEEELKMARGSKLNQSELVEIRADAFNEGFAAARKLFSGK